MAMANDLASRVLRTTVELRQLEFEIRAALETISQNSTPLERIDSKITAEFRDALDLTRHALWSYLAACGGATSAASMEAVHSYRMTRVTQMLRMLRASGPGELNAVQGCEGFIEQVQEMAALTLDKALAKKASAA